MVISHDNYEMSLWQVSLISYEMTTSVKFCLSYDPFRWDFIAFKTNIISLRKCTADMDVVNDVTCSRRSVIT